MNKKKKELTLLGGLSYFFLILIIIAFGGDYKLSTTLFFVGWIIMTVIAIKQVNLPLSVLASFSVALAYMIYVSWT